MVDRTDAAAGVNTAITEGTLSTVPSLKSRTLSATAWTLVGAVASNALRLAANLVVTRLLFPEAFGLMLIASGVLYIVSMLSDVGFHQSIVRGPRGDDPRFLDTAWTLKIVRGALMWVSAVGFAVGLNVVAEKGWFAAGSTYADPLLPWVIAASAFTAFIAGFEATGISSANRRLQMKPLVLLDLISQVISIALMLVLAWQLRSVWALVISGLLGAAVRTLLSHWLFRGHRNRFCLDRSSLRELIGFGRWLALSSAITAFSAYGDRILLAGLVSAAALGLFSVAATLAGAIDMVVQQLFSRVMLPALSEVARTQPDRIAMTFRRLRWRIDPMLLLLAGALFALGPLVVSLLYDARYHDAGRMLQILSLGLVVARFSIVQQVYLALNEPRYHVVLNAVRLASVYIAVPLSFHAYGLQGALIAIALKELPTLPLIYWFNSRHGLNNLRLECVWLLFWPLGYALGLGTEIAYASIARHA